MTFLKASCWGIRKTPGIVWIWRHTLDTVE
jgi:hypothetical protein